MELIDLLTIFHSLRECTDAEAIRATLSALPSSAATEADVHALSVALMEPGRHRLDDRGAALESGIRERLLERTQLSLTLVNALDAIVAPLGAEAGALVMEDGTTFRRNRVLAGVGLHHWLALERDLSTSVADFGASRFIVPFRVGSDRYAALELLCRPGETFSPAHASLCARAVNVLQSWLAGMVEGGRHVAPTEGELLDSDSFETRARVEFERAARFHAGVGLLVVDTPHGVRDRHAMVLGPLVQHVRRHLRAKDAIGRLRDGRLGVLVVETDERGLSSVTSRMGHQVAGLGDDASPAAALIGTAWFPTCGRDFRTLVASALDDLQRQAAPLLDGV